MRSIGFLRALCGTRLGLPGAPRVLTFIVTFACNARCVMCGSWKKKTAGELDTDGIERIFRQMPRLDVVRITGGEPFLRRDIGDIVSMAGRILRPAIIHITTNGILTERIVKLCRERDLRVPLFLMVSLDGMAASHDRIRGKPGTWERAMRTIRELAPRRRSLNLRLYVNQTVIDEGGAHEYGALRNCLREYGVRHNVVFAYDGSATYGEDGERSVVPGAYDGVSCIGNASLSAFLKEVDDDIRTAELPVRAAKRYYLRGLKNRLLENSNLPNPPCAALNTHLRLNPDGSVPVCHFNSATVGSLRHETFRDLWYGARIHTLRSWVRTCPGCWAECEVLPSALYSGALIRDYVAGLFDLTRNMRRV